MAIDNELSLQYGFLAQRPARNRDYEARHGARKPQYGRLQNARRSRLTGGFRGNEKRPQNKKTNSYECYCCGSLTHSVLACPKRTEEQKQWTLSQWRLRGKAQGRGRNDRYKNKRFGKLPRGDDRRFTRKTYSPGRMNDTRNHSPGRKHDTRNRFHSRHPGGQKRLAKKRRDNTQNAEKFPTSVVARSGGSESEDNDEDLPTVADGSATVAGAEAA